ncbi:hydro-lyase, Fe-S type, tartrate/fumarate subfamily, alpha subunit [Methanocaldococcus vulcanius M7]|uniref:Hydro-lyase, Fe-S type, tartrate/fumarate subfamily, alpha subunit n=1 Tax=Methanocaldococcus vulcanius (strain ATCC 700851 / DSM 12094 / M7) TaxID=579137 RepID=C9RFM5_METVM|nr:fumarate hydratase [Methanocaldococcus vulcanius]ACX72377.1 hydro-lyase, Fe-S type, tartrate/fumarate subfamily, alpha subunit [Methanocaldococcus vulcanius M7]
MDISEIVVELFKEAVVLLPQDVNNALNVAYSEETENLSKNTLKAIIENNKIAEQKQVPLCQDTGVPIIFLKIGKNINSSEIMEIMEDIKEGVKKATETIPLRPNVVHPITRENFKTNVGLQSPFIQVEFDEKLNREIEITVFPKGAGSENMSALKMLTPSDGIKGVKEFILKTVVEAGGKPCPPIVVGVGIGGTADIALKLAKKALLRKIGERHPDEKIAKLEKELLEKINKLGIGAMGLGGKITSLDVFIEIAGCHTASLPVGVCIQCWANRKASRRIKLD